MNKIKVMTVFGTRPEAIKMAPVVKELEARDEFTSIVCVTAQHREMLDQVLDIFSLRPDFDLDIMRNKQTLTDITVRALEGIRTAIEKAAPDLVLVHGDTTTTLAGSLAAYYTRTKLGHVEAGLRTNDKFQPYPEEMNRRITSVISDINFAPTETAKSNLLKENHDPEKIFVTGNTVIDTLKHTISSNYMFNEKTLNTIDFKSKRVITVTAHRRENLGEPLKNICLALKDIAETFPDVEIVYPVHRNPSVTGPVSELLGNVSGIRLISPLDLTDMHNLMNNSFFVMTDSGGLQEEVPSMGKPVIVLRNVTERPEGVAAGTLKLAGTDRKTVFDIAKTLLNDKDEYKKMAQAKNPFGDGLASARIAEAILYSFGRSPVRPEEYK